MHENNGSRFLKDYMTYVEDVPGTADSKIWKEKTNKMQQLDVYY